MTRRTLLPKIPEIPFGIDKDLAVFLKRVKELVEVKSLDRGNYLDGHPTRQELVDAGLISSSGNGNGNIGSGSGGDSTPLIIDTGKDTTIPPAIQGLAVEVAFKNVYLSWLAPNFKNYSHVNIYRSKSNTFSSATKVGQAPFNLYMDSPNSSSAGDTYYYWVTAVSTSDIEGPANAIDGLVATILPTLDYIESVIKGFVDQSWIDDVLRERINKIDNPTTGILKQLFDQNAKDQELDQKFGVIYAKQTSDLLTLNAAIQNLQTTQATDKQALAQSIATLGAQLTTNKTETSAAIQQINKTIADSLTALASSSSTISASFQGQIDNTNALIQQLSTASASQYNALSNSVTTLQTSVNGNTASIKQAFESVDGLKARASLVIDVNGKLTGWSIGAEPDGSGGTVSSMFIDVDNFFVGEPDSNGVRPFQIITVNGQPHIYLDAQTMIRAAAIESAQIQSLAANKITAGTINVSVTMNAAHIRGGDIVIGANPATGKYFSVSENGFMRATGALIDGNAVIEGDVIIRGHLDGASGTFNGTVYAENIEGDILDSIFQPVEVYKSIKSTASNDKSFKILLCHAVTDPVGSSRSFDRVCTISGREITLSVEREYYDYDDYSYLHEMAGCSSKLEIFVSLVTEDKSTNLSSATLRSESTASLGSIGTLSSQQFKNRIYSKSAQGSSVSFVIPAGFRCEIWLVASLRCYDGIATSSVFMPANSVRCDIYKKNGNLDFKFINQDAGMTI